MELETNIGHGYVRYGPPALAGQQLGIVGRLEAMKQRVVDRRQYSRLVMMGAAACMQSIACSSATIESPSPSPTVPEAEATILPGDAVSVEVWREADASGTFNVDDRGIVILPLLGERRVSGATPDSMRAMLVGQYSAYFQTASIQVTILRRISVTGEVRNPGLYPVDTTVTLADAIAQAGGILPTGNTGDIRLLRDDRVIQQHMDQASVVGSSEIRSGDQIVVGQKSWASRNSGAIAASLIAATAIIGAAIITN